VAKKPIQTNEFPSFVRQLNLYGFRKHREEEHRPWLNHYIHKDGYFLRGREDLLSRIIRSGANRNVSEVSELRKCMDFYSQYPNSYMPDCVPIFPQGILPPAPPFHLPTNLPLVPANHPPLPMAIAHNGEIAADQFLNRESKIKIEN
jgi:hypothetical protein